MWASFHPSYTVLKGNSVICKNKGTSLWNFAPNSGFRQFRHGISIVETCYQLSSKKVDAQNVINWSVVGQLSWQYLRAPTLDHYSSSHRSSSAVYSTILSYGSISDSWYLVQDLSYKKFLHCCVVRGNWQDFNWHDASRGPSAIAELLVKLADKSSRLWCMFYLWISDTATERGPIPAFRDWKTLTGK